MNRILTRPMFRRGGSASGITTGLDTPKRGLVNEPGSYGGGINYPETYKSAQDIARQIYPQEETDLNPFLMNFGLDLLSRPPQGGLLSTVASSARAPTAQLFQDIKEQKATRRATEAGLFEALIKAQADDGTGKNTLSKVQYQEEVKELTGKLIKNYNNYENSEQGPKDREVFNMNNQALANEMEVYLYSNKTINALYGTETAIENRISEAKKKVLRDRPDLADDPAALDYEIRAEYNKIRLEKIFEELTGMRFKQLERKAEGGRIGYQNAGPVMPSAQQGIMAQAPMTMDQGSTENELSFEELRARLPSEITDDIIILISQSPQALEDFASIQTQQDVNNFNIKYGVQLTLPSGV